MRISDWSSDVCSSDLGLDVQRQAPIPIRYDGVELPEGFRADLLIEGKLLVELKSVERLSPLHGKKVLTYLRLLGLPLGLLINFGGETFKEGIRRVDRQSTRLKSSH